MRDLRSAVRLISMSLLGFLFGDLASALMINNNNNNWSTTDIVDTASLIAPAILAAQALSGHCPFGQRFLTSRRRPG